MGLAEAVATGTRNDGDADAPPPRPAPRQIALPVFRQVLYPDGGADFAHPFERDFSRVLSYYRIRWAYEPTSFVLAWADDGRPAEMFTPDFYLPEQRLYVELTTMRQRLVTRKHRKLRRLRELYPNVRIKLLYRRDYHRLSDCYRAVLVAADPGRPGEVVHPEAVLRARIESLAAGIVADQAALGAGAGVASPASGPVLVLGVGRGSAVFRASLVAAMRAGGLACDEDRIDVARHHQAGRGGNRTVRVRHRPGADLAGRRVLLVEDVVSTGLTLRYLLAWLRQRRVAAVDVCTLLDRRVARLVDVPVRYVGFEAPNQLLVGFGLDLRRQFAELPFIATLVAD